MQNSATKARRRLSVDDTTGELVSSIRNAVDNLKELWDRVHMDQGTREERLNNAYKHLYSLLHDIINCEQALIGSVHNEIEEKRVNVAQLRKLFGMTTFAESDYPPGSIALLKSLQKEELRLADRKQKEINLQLALYKRYQELCHRTESEMFEIEGIAEKIVENSELEAIRHLIGQMETAMNMKIIKLKELQSECISIRETLGSNCHISKDEIKLLQIDFGCSETVVTSEAVRKLHMLNEKLQSQHDEWMEQMIFRYDEFLVKLDGLSKMCFQANQRYNPDDFHPSKCDDETLGDIESRIRILEEKYQRGRPVYDKLAEWKSLWDDKLRTEQNVCRNSFYHKRGGAMMKELDRQKKVAVQMPKVLAGLKAAVAEYISLGYDPQDILVEDLLPDKYAEFLIEEHKKDKEIQRAQKSAKSHKKENLATPAKSGKGNNTDKASSIATVTKRKRSFSCSQMSMISPTNTPSRGPTTSSPKRVNLDSSSALNGGNTKFAKSSNGLRKN